MGTHNPIFINDYRDGYSYAVHCERHGQGPTPWTMAVEVFRDDVLALPRRLDHGRAFATYDDARAAGVQLATKLIDQLLESAR
ncbi:hypothetical protein [uncultured Pigmentiphaga sp.]|jgi:hypothetical protein|uniref:hypothetical protein n=1 Tax=uncultured Pigmentiphaga sp. TaxID=340361 RepID=UPI0026112B29|nr:hypothetical protein [uncultured Pigmentiphaga sp.]